MRKQRVILRHKTNVPFLRRNTSFNAGVEPNFIVKLNRSFFGMFQSGEATKHRRFARTRRAEQHGDAGVVRAGAQIVRANHRAAGEPFHEAGLDAGRHVLLPRCNRSLVHSAVNARASEMPASVQA